MCVFVLCFVILLSVCGVVFCCDYLLVVMVFVRVESKQKQQ